MNLVANITHDSIDLVLIKFNTSFYRACDAALFDHSYNFLPLERLKGAELRIVK